YELFIGILRNGGSCIVDLLQRRSPIAMVRVRARLLIHQFVSCCFYTSGNGYHAMDTVQERSICVAHGDCTLKIVELMQSLFVVQQCKRQLYTRCSISVVGQTAVMG